MTENNHQLCDYLALHDRIPKKRIGLFQKRQRTFNELIEFVKSEANRMKSSVPVNTEQQMQERLNTYLRLSFSVNGWWAKRVTELLAARKFDEINAVEEMSKPYNSGTR